MTPDPDEIIRELSGSYTIYDRALQVYIKRQREDRPTVPLRPFAWTGLADMRVTFPTRAEAERAMRELLAERAQR